MKRFFKILGILLLFIVAAAIFIPIIFEDEIEDRAKSEINKNLNATVTFEDIGVSLFSRFPNFSVSIDDFTVDGQGEFEGTRLAEVADFNLEIDLFSVLFGDAFEILAIDLKDADIHVVINEEGKANYDIYPSGESDTAVADTSASGGFKMVLQGYSIENFNLIYDDREGEMKVIIKELNHSGSGDFSESIVNLTTQTSIEAFTFKMEEVAYLSHVNVQSDFDMTFDQEAFKFTFGENHVGINNLILNFTGTVAMPGDDIDMDLKFNTPESSFKSLLSLIPAIYTQDFEDLTASGNFNIEGSAKGTYNGDLETYPAYSLALKVSDGSFQYPDLPAGVNNVHVDLIVVNESSDLDGTVVNLREAIANIAGNPFEARFLLKNPISDPDFNASVKTNLNLANLNKVVPSECFEYEGTVDANFQVAGVMSDINAERYESVQASGDIRLNNLYLQSDSLPYVVEVSQAHMSLAPQEATLHTFEAKLGESDLNANGSIKNLMAYYLNDEVLKGDFSFSSSYLNINELYAPEPDAENNETKPEDTTAMAVIRLPEDIKFLLNASIDQLLYDDLNIRNISGTIMLENGQASMEKLTMDMLEGSMALSGVYNSVPDAPEVSMDFKIKGFSFQESFEKFVTIQRLAPIMKNTSGNYSTGLNFDSKLNPDMSPDLSSVNASGTLSTSKLVTSGKALGKVAQALNNESLAALEIGAMALDFAIQDGQLKVEPFDFKAGQIGATVFGTSNLDQSIDYTMNLNIPVSGINASALLEKIGASQGAKVNLGVNITGTYTDPKISTSLGDLAKGVVDNLKEKAREKVEEVKQEAKDEVNKKAQQLISQAEAKGDALIAAAEEQAAKLVAEARKQADNIRAEADKQASKIEAEAEGNFLKEKAAKAAADEVRKKAETKATELVNAAQQKGEQLIDEAKKRKESLVDEARQKGQVQ